MTSSMTGFSFKDKSTQCGSLIIEIKTLNSRYYELNLKTSDLFKIYESKIREIIAAKVFRGKVDCKIFYRAKENSSKQLIDSKELKNLIVSSENIAKKLKNPAPIDPLDIFQLLSNQNLNISDKNLKKEILSLLEEAIQDLVTDRRREGLKIRQVIIKNLRAISSDTTSTLMSSFSLSRPKIPPAFLLSTFPQNIVVRSSLIPGLLK